MEGSMCENMVSSQVLGVTTENEGGVSAGADG